MGVVGQRHYAEEARYLGPYLTPQNAFDTELGRRCAKLEQVFGMWHRFWVAAIPL